MTDLTRVTARSIATVEFEDLFNTCDRGEVEARVPARQGIKVDVNLKDRASRSHTRLDDDGFVAAEKCNGRRGAKQNAHCTFNTCLRLGALQELFVEHALGIPPRRGVRRGLHDALGTTPVRW